jgi:cutinase
MLRIRSLAVLAASACAASGLVFAGPALAAQTSCATAVFETDGYHNGESLANFAGFNSHVPAGYEAHPIPYQDGIFPVVDAKTLDDAVAGGKATLDAAVRSFHAQCPGSHLVISGYSEGALVAGDELDALSRSDAIPHDLINGILYGDPRREFGDGGVGGVAGGIETNLPTILPGVTMRGPRGFGDLAVHEICNENDGICNSTNMITNALAFANGLDGYASGDHGYDIDPVRDIGSGLTLNLQPARIGYGPPLPLPIGTPWQIQQQLGDSPGALAAVRTALATVNSALPEPLKQALRQLPWYQLVSDA